MNNKQLTDYFNTSIKQLVDDILKNTLNNPKETAFLMRFAKASRKAEQVRTRHENAGKHIPAFLISSIADTCNLTCTGCYARANGSCGSKEKKGLLSPQEWADIFKQARDAGIVFSLIAGGEPLLRKDVLEQAASIRNMAFPVFTNGTLINKEYLSFFDKNRNILPILSIEGGLESTDKRRGTGTYGELYKTMGALQSSKILYGASVTVTTENLLEVTSLEFISELKSKGCKLVFFIEYVPIDGDTAHLALNDAARRKMEARQELLRKEKEPLAYLSFPGDEQFMGGCLAAGRGFFHINPYGDAEACPFSPYSDINLKTHSLLEVLESPFFQKLQAERLVGGEHTGGCALFEREKEVQALLQNRL